MARLGLAGLTAKQAAFCEQYLIDLNATQAAIRVGYSAKTANQQAARLLANVKVQDYIKQLQQQQQVRSQINADWVLRELVNIAKANGADYAEVDEHGAVKLIPTALLTADKKAAISSIKPTMAGAEIKTYDRIRALELIGKHLGMFDSAAAKAGPEKDVEDLTPLADMLNEGDTDDPNSDD